jgi:hypothetical protein
MKKNLIFTSLLTLTFLAFTACEEEEPIIEEEPNPFENLDEWNGFTVNDKEYSTPNAIIEIWGENLDSLSSDYDVTFTDGSFSYLSRSVLDQSIMVYFDANSPNLNDLSPGTYYIENTNTRKPGNIVEAYIQISTAGMIIKYPILGGEVTVTEESGFYKVDYKLRAIVDKEEAEVVGQYSGDYTIVDQTSL